MKAPLHVKLRKKIRVLSHSILSAFFPVAKNPKPLQLERIQKILLVRINYRIGNILFITPLINAIHEAFPHAQIDMMIGAPFISPLIKGMPQITNVYSFPRELLKKPLQLYRFVRALNRNQYDLMITPNTLSSSDRIFTFVVKAKHKIGFYSSEAFVPFTHSLASPEAVKHEALIPLELMPLLGLDQTHSLNRQLDLRLSPEEKAAVKAQIPAHAIGIFRDARNEKKIEASWWAELLDALKQLDQNFTFIEILDPNNKVPLNEAMPTISDKNLRTLAAKIAHLDAFICGDTGPMHLASAAKTPTIALFKTTSPSTYGTLGDHDLSLVMAGLDVKEIAHKIYAHLLAIHQEIR